MGARNAKSTATRRAVRLKIIRNRAERASRTGTSWAASSGDVTAEDARRRARIAAIGHNNNKTVAAIQAPRVPEAIIPPKHASDPTSGSVQWRRAALRAKSRIPAPRCNPSAPTRSSPAITGVHQPPIRPSVDGGNQTSAGIFSFVPTIAASCTALAQRKPITMVSEMSPRRWMTG